MEILGERLKWLRKSHRFSQKEVASKIGMTTSGYQKIENSERDPKLDVLVSLANIYDVSSDLLLGINHMTKQLKILRLTTAEAHEKINLYEEKLNTVRENIIDIQNQIDTPSPYIGRGDSEQRSEIEILKKQLEYYSLTLCKAEYVYEENIFNYIIETYKIPGSQPQDDELIKDLLPFDLIMSNYDGKNYKVELKSLSGRHLGLLFNSEDTNKETNYSEAKKQLEVYKGFFRLKS